MPTHTCMHTYIHTLIHAYLCITYVKYHIICQQIFSEFNRIFEKEIIKDIKEIWFETIPKIFGITKFKSNAKLRSLYEEGITCTSEGMTRC